jgi:ATP-dependent helicase/nuclease subunit B
MEVEHGMVESIQTCTFAIGGSKTMRGWIEVTLEAMRCLDMDVSLATTPAGTQVLELFEQLATTFNAGAELFTLKEWRKFLSMQFEAAAFIAPGTDTRVVMLPLNGARMRNFEGVLVAGADANHLPSQITDKMFFANAVRRELGLSTREQLQCQQLRDLTEVLQSGAEVVISYQGVKNGEVVAISPWIDRLQLTLARAGVTEVPIVRPKFAKFDVTPVRVAQPAPSAPQLTPSMISPSGYNSLMACPYQYFVTRMLRLNKLKDLLDEAEKRNYGEWLHEILYEFHTTLLDDEEADRFELLSKITDKVFARELPKSPASLGYYARWKKVIPVYLQWLEEREAQGWHFVMGEKKLEKLLEYDGGKLLVEARIDRCDQHIETKEYDVLDYKGMSFASLTMKLKDPEDQQLPISGMVLDTPARSGRFVSLEMAEVKKSEVEAKHFTEWMGAVERRIVGNVIAIRSGHRIPANGNGKACEYCDVRGLCRKSSWDR